MDSWIFLFLFVLTTSFVNCLEFSQFYLPQCCYIAPPPGNQQQLIPIHPSPSYRHDIKARKAEPGHIISLVNPQKREQENPTNETLPSTSSSSTRKNRVSKKSASRLYRYIIPLKKPEILITGNEAKEQQVVEKETTSPLPVVRLRENRFKTRKSLRKDMKTEDLLLDTERLLSSAQIETELTSSMSTKIKQMLLNNKNNSTSTLPSIESILFPKNMTSESMLKFKRNAQVTEQEGQEEETDVNKVTTMNDDDGPSKMPPNWVTNLRRAIYQSMESLLMATKSKSDNSKSSQEEIIQAKSSNNGNPYQQSSHEVQGNNVLWQKVRDANFTMVEPVTRYSRTLPQTLYLPNGQGPVASGVVVNTVNGMQLRMASELNRLDAGSGVNDCSCHLIHNGEILMAYWSVSRIINEKGQQALQYLIYPLPYNTPTPPVMIPFNGDKNIASSPYDPIPNLHQDYGKVFETIGQRPHSHRHGARRKMVGVRPGYGQLDTYQELMPQHFQELPVDLPIQNPQNQVAFPPNYEQTIKNLQQFNQLPPPGLGLHGPTVIPPGSGYPGVMIENEHGYTPEFINIYKQAVQNHIQHKDQYEKGTFQQNVNFPQPLPAPPTHPSPDIYGSIDKNFAPPPPSHIQLFDGKAPTFPKSIQDILSPFPPTISLPHNIPGLGQHPNFEGQQHSQHGQDNGLQEYHGGVINPHNIHPDSPQLHLHDELPPGTGGGDLVAQPPQKGLNVNNYYSFAGGVKGHHYAHPQSGPGGFVNHAENIGGDYRPHYHDDLNNQRRGPQHTVYPDHRHRPSISSNRPGTRFTGSNDDGIRYYHRQELPTRHRSEKYSRPHEKRYNPDGSYILNF